MNMQLRKGAKVVLHVWGGAGFDEIEGTIKDVCYHEYHEDNAIILEEDDDYAYALTDIITVDGEAYDA